MSWPPVVVGIDLVQVSQVQASLQRFKERFMERIFTADEIQYCLRDEHAAAQRFAARFAAKEATLKVLRPDDEGIGWRSIEVRRSSSGWCDLVLHGAAHRRATRVGLAAWSLSMSHESNYATAVVVAVKDGAAERTHD